jgi:hypothetical protein
MLLLSKATQKELTDLNDLAKKEGLLIEMRNKQGVLLCIGTGLLSLTEEKDKKGKPLYRVESFKKLNYDVLEEIVTYDVKLAIYEGFTEREVNPKVQEFYNKQEDYWFRQARKWFSAKFNLLKDSDVIINRLKQ